MPFTNKETEAQRSEVKGPADESPGCQNSKPVSSPLPEQPDSMPCPSPLWGSISSLKQPLRSFLLPHPVQQVKAFIKHLLYARPRVPEMHKVAQGAHSLVGRKINKPMTTVQSESPGQGASLNGVGR